MPEDLRAIGAIERELCCQWNPQGAQDSGVEQGHPANLKEETK